MTNRILLVAAALGLLLIVAGALFYISGTDKPPADAGALVRPHSPSFGDSSARVHIVEFFDPACETCRSFYPFVKQMIAANPGRIRLSIRYAPFHKGSDDIVRLLEASKKQGKYWETMDQDAGVFRQWEADAVLRLRAAENARRSGLAGSVSVAAAGHDRRTATTPRL